MGRSNLARGGERDISPEVGTEMLATFCPDLHEWPHRWRFDDDDLEFGRALVDALTPFLRNLLRSELSQKARARHRDHLWMLGGELIRRLYDEPQLRTQPPEAVIRHYIDDEGGPLIYPSITEAQQRSFDATCRKLHRFLGVPGLAE
jgi:hypothetical protein